MGKNKEASGSLVAAEDFTVMSCAGDSILMSDSDLRFKNDGITLEKYSYSSRYLSNGDGQETLTDRNEMRTSSEYESNEDQRHSSAQLCELTSSSEMKSSTEIFNVMNNSELLTNLKGSADIRHHCAGNEARAHNTRQFSREDPAGKLLF